MMVVGGDWERVRGRGYLWGMGRGKGRMGAGREEEKERVLYVISTSHAVGSCKQCGSHFNYTTSKTTPSLSLFKSTFKQIIRRQLLVLVARKICLNHRLVRKPQRFKLLIVSIRLLFTPLNSPVQSLHVPLA